MRLHRLTLQDVRGVRQRTVEFPDDGVLVIEGPNEVGKSTLLEAFDRLLDPRAKATSLSARIRELQPVGRDVAPFVEAEFSLGRYRLRFAKQWLRSPSTTLEVLAPVREQLSGAAAQSRLDAILEESLDRTLWEALRFTQAGQLTQLALTDSGVLTRALDGASGVGLHSAGGSELLDRVESEYLRYHTPTGRASGEFKAAMTAATLAQAEAAQAHGRLQETQVLIDRHRRLVQAHARSGSARPKLQTALDRAQEQAATVQRVVDAHRDAMARLEQAKESSVRAAGDLAQRRQAAEGLAASEDALARAQESLLVEERAVDGLVEGLADLVGNEQAARDALDSARDVADRSQADAAHLAEVAELETLAQRAAGLVSVLRELGEAEQALGAAAVTADLLRRIEDADRDLAVSFAQHRAAGAVLSVEALAGGQVIRVDGAEQTLEPGQEAIHLQAHDDVQLEVPGALRITLRPAAEDRSRADQVAAARERLGSALQEAGSADIDAARRIAQRRASAQAEVTRLRSRAEDLAAGVDQAELAARLERLQDEVEAYRAGRPRDCLLPGDVPQARAVSRAARAAYEQARVTAAQVAHRLQAAELDSTRLRLALEKRRGSVESQRDRLEVDRLGFAQAQSRVDDQTLERAVAQRSGEYARVEAVAGEARREMRAADVEGVHSRLEAAKQRLQEHDQEAAKVRDDLLSVTAQVEMASGEGRQETYDQAVAAFDHVRATLEAVDRRARAARQLHLTLGRHRDTAHRAYVRPYAQEIERLGRMVYGETFAVEVDEDLTIRARHLEGTLVAFEQLSGGAKEQLGILARLAVASLVDRDHGVPVIIDDALGYTDPDRLHRVGAVFDGPADRAQVILLTCTPDRYSDIPNARTIRFSA